MASDRKVRRGPGRRLDPQKAREIAEAIARGERHTVIAAQHGVSVETVGAIKAGTRWASAIDSELRDRMRASSAGAVLDETGARAVMAALEAGSDGRTIAQEFGISPSLVSAIKTGRSWAWLDPELPQRLSEMSRQGKSLAQSDVAKIKGLLRRGQASRPIAKQFGVSASTVQAIARGRTWADVEPE